MHSNDLMWQSKHKRQQIIFHCSINLKVVLHRNRMKPMEIFAFQSPQRFHCKIRSYNVFVITIFCRTTVSARPEGWHQVCDAVLNIKHGGTETKTAFTLVQVLQRLITFPCGISSFFLLKKYPLFLWSASVLNASKGTNTLV